MQATRGVPEEARGDGGGGAGAGTAKAARGLQAVSGGTPGCQTCAKMQRIALDMDTTWKRAGVSSARLPSPVEEDEDEDEDFTHFTHSLEWLLFTALRGVSFGSSSDGRCRCVVSINRPHVPGGVFGDLRFQTQTCYVSLFLADERAASPLAREHASRPPPIAAPSHYPTRRGSKRALRRVSGTCRPQERDMPSSGAGTRNALAHSQPFGQISSCGEVETGAERCAGVSEDAQARVYALAEHTGRHISGVTRRSTSSNLR